MNKLSLFIFINLSLVVKLYAQKSIAWDNTTVSSWNTSFRQVEIPSSLDNKIQKAYLYASQSKSPKPLIISLHTVYHSLLKVLDYYAKDGVHMAGAGQAISRKNEREVMKQNKVLCLLFVSD